METVYDEHTNVSPYVVDNEREYVLQDYMVRHLWCMIPDYKSGGNVTKCYYADGTDEVVHRPILRLFYDLAKYLAVDLRALHNTMGQRASYNQPRTLSVNMTWIPFKTRKPVGKDGAYGYFNIVVPFTYMVSHGPTEQQCYIHGGHTEPILLLHPPTYVRKKLDAAMMEHRRYVRRILEYMRMCGNPDVLAELYIACHFHNN